MRPRCRDACLRGTPLGHAQFNLALMTNNVVHDNSCRYTDAGTHNCCGEPGSLGYEDIDMATFASWGECHIGLTHVLTDRQRHLAQVKLWMCCW